LFDFEKPNEIAVVAALTAAFFVFLGVLSMDVYLERPYTYSYYFVFPLIIGLLVFLVVRYTVGRFLVRKIKLIYRNINDEKLTLSLRDRYSPDLDEVNKDVQQWARKKMKEIAKLKVKEKYRKEFVGNVSHELRTPIFNIQGYILTLLEGGLEDEEINREYLLRANKSVERMIRLVDDLELISKLEENQLDLEMQSFNIVEEVNELFSALDFRARKRGVELRVGIGADKSYEVLADQSKVRQVLTNLINNGINYRNEDRESFVEIRFHDVEKKILIEVVDNGAGIPSKDISRVFERFYRVDKSRSRDRGGTGLGLAIVKHIIEAHRERISVSSAEGEGSTFSFSLKKV
jgi:two-component system phosphate regulon sensor histidine kinase PhoR